MLASLQFTDDQQGSHVNYIENMATRSEKSPPLGRERNFSEGGISKSSPWPPVLFGNLILDCLLNVVYMTPQRPDAMGLVSLEIEN